MNNDQNDDLNKYGDTFDDDVFSFVAVVVVVE